MLRMMESVETGFMKVEDSKYLADKVALMKRQYVNAIWPDMTRDFQVINVPIMAVGGKYDADASKSAMSRWQAWTTSKCFVRIIEAGHMETVDDPSLFVKDMVRLY